MRPGGHITDAVGDLGERIRRRRRPRRRPGWAPQQQHERQQRERRRHSERTADADEHDAGECSGERWCDDAGAVHAQHRQRDGVAELFTPDDFRCERHTGRPEESEGDALHDRRDEQHPELHAVGEHHGGHSDGSGQDRALAHDQHASLGKPVCGDATQRGGDQECDPETEVDEPERSLSFGEIPGQHAAQQELHLHRHERERAGPPQFAIVEILQRREGALEP